MNIKKKKVSIDFNEANYCLVVQEAKDRGESNSMVINDMISTILTLSHDTKNDLAIYCKNQQDILYKNIHYLDIDSMEYQEKLLKMKQYEKLIKLFGDIHQKEDDNMRRILLKEGYCIFPKDWIMLDPIEGEGSAEDCMYAGVVECRNGKRWNVPHFVYFCNYKYGSDYPSDFEDKVYKQCEKKYPRFKELFNMQMELSFADMKDPEKVKEFSENPCFGLFSFVEKGDPLFWNSASPNYKTPAGTLIVRE